MVVNAPSNINTLARSIGYIVDRTKVDDNYLGNAWLIDNDKVATCAHLVSSYSNFLDALLIRFPGSGKDYAVESAMFHPQFDRTAANQLLQVSLTEPMPAIPLQKHNAAVLKLKEDIPPLSDTVSFKVNKNLSLPIPPREQGLGGNLREIDLFVVIQSITNARKEGIITICDQRNYPVARIFCQNGRLVYAQYRNLVNEMAIYQIVNRELNGNFFFWAADRPNWEVTTAIAKPTEMVLIEAHRRFDELRSLISLIGNPETLYERKHDQPNLEVLPGNVKDYCRRLWDLLDGGTPVGQLWQISNLDDFSIYVTLSELKRTQQIAITVKKPLEPSDDSSPPEPLPMAVNTVLEPYDKITSIHIDIETGRALARDGSLLGTLRDQDKYHLLHNVRLVPEATGSPLFKDSQVIGMHCGPMPPNYQSQQSEGVLQGMLWVDSVVECLRGGGENKLAEKLTLLEMPRGASEQLSDPDQRPNPEPDQAQSTDQGPGEEPQSNAQEDAAPASGDAAQNGEQGKSGKKANKRKGQGGCNEVAKVDCPKCGRTSLESSRYCKSCGQQLLEAATFTKRKAGTPLFLVLALLLLLGVGGVSYLLMSLPSPTVISGDSMVIPEVPWVKLHVYKKTPVKKADSSPNGPSEFFWELQPEGTIYKEKDLIHLKLDVNRKAYVYLIYAGSGQPSLIYPVSQVSNKVLEEGASFTFPSEVSEYVEGSLRNLVGLEMHNSPGTETFMVLASPKKLQLLGNPAAIQEAYKRATEDVQGTHSDTGVEDSLAIFCKGLIANDNLKDVDDGKNKSAGDSIFIDRYLIKHVK